MATPSASRVRREPGRPAGRKPSGPAPALRWQPEPAGWQRRPCLDTDLELWFGPEESRTETPTETVARVQDAKELCSWCPVREFCLDRELALGPFDQHGIRGGLTAEERQKLIRRRARQAGRSAGTEAA